MRTLTAQTIIDQLASADDGYRVKQRIVRQAAVADLLAALETAPPVVRQVLCDILGARSEMAAVPALIGCLQDPSSGIRNSAADALGKIGLMAAGPALLERFLAEDDTGMQHLLASALGAVGYRPAIPHLIHALGSPDKVLRNCAAWGLGILGASEAQPALQAIYSDLGNEDSPHSRKLLSDALAAVKLVAQAQAAPTREDALRRLIGALKRRALRPAAAWMLGTLRAYEALPALHAALVSAPGILARY